jgi:hypothetical protein
MVANSLAVAGGIRASSGREWPPMEHDRDAGQTRESFSLAYRELNAEHTPESRSRPSRLGENKCRNATACSSFRRHFAAARLQTGVRRFRSHWQASSRRISFKYAIQTGAPGNQKLFDAVTPSLGPLGSNR